MSRNVKDKHYSTKDHYDELWKRVNELEKPTIADAIKIMRKMGNAGWWDADEKLHRPATREESFEEQEILHEMGHLFAISGHTPFQEGFNGALEDGFRNAYHDNIENAADNLQNTLESYGKNKIRYYYQTVNLSKEQIEQAEKEVEERIPYSPRDIAINYAAGI